LVCFETMIDWMTIIKRRLSNSTKIHNLSRQLKQVSGYFVNRKLFNTANHFFSKINNNTFYSNFSQYDEKKKSHTQSSLNLESLYELAHLFQFSLRHFNLFINVNTEEIESSLSNCMCLYNEWRKHFESLQKNRVKEMKEKLKPPCAQIIWICLVTTNNDKVKSYVALLFSLSLTLSLTLSLFFLLLFVCEFLEW
jgi:hypothetical protein